MPGTPPSLSKKVAYGGLLESKGLDLKNFFKPIPGEQGFVSSIGKGRLDPKSLMLNL